MVAHSHSPNHDEIPQYYMQQLIGEFILHLNMDYIDFGTEFYAVGKGYLTESIGPSHSGEDCIDSRPSHGDRSRIPRSVSNDEVYHMSVEDLRSLYFKYRDYIHSTNVATRECDYRTDYVDSSYEMEHAQASFLDDIMDDACQEYMTSASMLTDRFLESSVVIAYERVGGAGPSREFEEPRVDLMFDLTQRWPSYTGPETIQIKHSEKPSVDFPSCTATPEVDHDFMTSPLGVEVMTCPDIAPMASVPESVLGSQTHDPTTSPLGLEVAGIDAHHVIGKPSQKIDEDPEDGDRIQ
eukprot:Gb_26432 [translate_table: standard]